MPGCRALIRITKLGTCKLPGDWRALLTPAPSELHHSFVTAALGALGLRLLESESL